MSLTIIEVLTFMVAVVGIVISIKTAIQQHKYNERDNSIGEDNIATDVHKQFAELWFMMDETFIEYPKLHKYFYSYNPDGEFRKRYPNVDQFTDELPDNEEDMERALCIAEKFRDVFQYSEHMAEKIIDIHPEDCASYVMYMQRIQRTKIYKKMLTLNHVEIEETKPIGKALGDKLVKNGYLSINDNQIVYSWAQKGS